MSDEPALCLTCACTKLSLPRTVRGAPRRCPSCGTWLDDNAVRCTCGLQGGVGEERVQCVRCNMRAHKACYAALGVDAAAPFICAFCVKPAGCTYQCVLCGEQHPSIRKMLRHSEAKHRISDPNVAKKKWLVKRMPRATDDANDEDDAESESSSESYSTSSDDNSFVASDNEQVVSVSDSDDDGRAAAHPTPPLPSISEVVASGGAGAATRLAPLAPPAKRPRHDAAAAAATARSTLLDALPLPRNPAPVQRAAPPTEKTTAFARTNRVAGKLRQGDDTVAIYATPNLCAEFSVPLDALPSLENVLRRAKHWRDQARRRLSDDNAEPPLKCGFQLDHGRARALITIGEPDFSISIDAKKLTCQQTQLDDLLAVVQEIQRTARLFA